MKVKELIARLERLDPDLPVMSIDLDPLDDVHRDEWDDDEGRSGEYVCLEFSEGE